MEKVIIFLVVFMLLMIAYLWSKKLQRFKKKAEQNIRMSLCQFYETEISNISKIELLAMEDDNNTDFKFIDAVDKIQINDDVRVKIYD